MACNSALQQRQGTQAWRHAVQPPQQALTQTASKARQPAVHARVVAKHHAQRWKLRAYNPNRERARKSDTQYGCFAAASPFGMNMTEPQLPSWSAAMRLSTSSKQPTSTCHDNASQHHTAAAGPPEYHASFAVSRTGHVLDHAKR